MRRPFCRLDIGRLRRVNDVRDRQEQGAEALVLAGLGGRVVDRDDGTRAAMPDRILELPDGRRAAVEVTSTVSGRLLGHVAAAEQHAGEEGGLSRAWTLSVAPGPRMRDLRRKVVPLLADLESRGIRSTATAQDLPYLDPTRKALERLGVELAVAYDGPGSIDFATPLGDGTEPTDVERAVAIANAFLASKEATQNVAKLVAAGRDESHLFLLIEDDQAGAARALEHSELPTTAPNLPDVLDGLWLATTERRAIYYTRAGGWRETQLNNSR
jgi:hypothetical protein